MSVDSQTISRLLDEQGTFASPGEVLSRRTIRPDGPAWARLGIVHGYGEHSGRYEQFMRHLARRGVACHTFDFRGHGLSTGRRGFVRQWHEYVADLSAFLDLGDIAPESSRGRTPLFLLGHSHGGLVLVAAALAGVRGVAGAVLINPYFRNRVRVPWHKSLLARCADRVMPWLRVPSGLRVEWLSSDPAMQRENRTDPLGLRIATPRWFRTTIAAQDQVMERAGEFRLPMLMLIGERDPVSDISAIERFLARAASADKTVLRYPEMLHEILRERGREEAFEDVLKWMRERA